jgi:hypothetical protein
MTAIMQMKLSVSPWLVSDAIQDRAAIHFPHSILNDNETHIASDCANVFPLCIASAANPFPKGVNVTMEYGKYLEVTPDALTSYYTASFLKEMSLCNQHGTCYDDVPESLQVGTSKSGPPL